MASVSFLPIARLPCALQLNWPQTCFVAFFCDTVADDGIGVLVSETPHMTEAHFRVPGVEAVYQLLVRTGVHATRTAAESNSVRGG